MKKNIIVLDHLIFYLQKTGGISSYWYELFKRLNNSENIILHNIVPTRLNKSNIYVNSVIESSSNIFIENLQPYLASFLKCKFNIDSSFIFHSSYNRISSSKYAINIITIHDLIPELFFKGWRKWLHQFRRLYFLKKANGIVCVSENTKNDLTRIYPFCKNIPIEVIYNGVSEDFFTIPKNEKKNQILFVGRRPLYKNFNFAVEVIKKIQKFEFVIVGEELNDKEKKLLEGVDYKLYSNITNEQLNILYNESFCLLYPSSYEGFGIPIVEALRCSCPVVALNKSAMSEITNKDSSILIEELNVEMFVESINSLNDISYRNKLIQNGLNKSLEYNWDFSSIKLSEFYNKLLN